MKHIVISTATPDDAEELGSLLARSFAHDPYAASLFGEGDYPKMAQLFTSQLRYQYLDDGCVDVATTNGTLAGVGVWSPPEGSAHSLRNRARMWPVYLRLVGRRLPAAAWAEHRVGAMAPSFPHWYLYLLGVDPEFQGAGIGRALLDYRIGAIAPNEAAYLEATSQGAARLYARYGFVPLGAAPLSPTASQLLMWRPAKAGTKSFSGMREDAR